MLAIAHMRLDQGFRKGEGVGDFAGGFVVVEGVERKRKWSSGAKEINYAICSLPRTGIDSNMGIDYGFAWRWKLNNSLLSLFTHKIKEQLSKDLGFIDYDNLTYGDIISKIQKTGLKICIDFKISTQANKNKIK